MDKTEFSASARPYPEMEQTHARLLDAAREALAWFRRFEQHAPEGEAFGGEGKVKRRLSEAVRLASFEVRECPY